MKTVLYVVGIIMVALGSLAGALFFVLGDTWVRVGVIAGVLSVFIVALICIAISKMLEVLEGITDQQERLLAMKRQMDALLDEMRDNGFTTGNLLELMGKNKKKD